MPLRLGNLSWPMKVSSTVTGASEAMSRSSGSSSLPSRMLGRTGSPATNADQTVRLLRQLDLQMLPAIVADAQRELGHHLAVIGDHGGQAGVVNQALQHLGLVVAAGVQRQLVAGAQVAIGQHGRGVRRGPSTRQLAHVNLAEQLAAGSGR